MTKPISKEKLVSKLDHHTCPKNVESLKIKKSNGEIKSERIQSCATCKYLKIQNRQSYVLKE